VSDLTELVGNRAGPVGDRPQGGAARSKRGRPFTGLKFLFAAALLSWVAKGLPWQDQLAWQGPAGAVQIEGRILGDWQADKIRFRPAPEAEIPNEWPVELAADTEAGAGVLVARHGPHTGFSWRPGLPRVLGGLSALGLTAALCLLLGGSLFGVTRWWRLLALVGCTSTWWNTLRLSYIGLFFNLVFPGLTGGDVPKALLVVRENPGKRTAALATVVIDRLVGLWALLGVAALASWSAGEALAPLVPSISAAFALASLGLGFLLFPGPRRILRVDAVVDRLPQADRLRRLEQAALVYASQPFELLLALLLSVGNHSCVIAAVFFLGRDLGDTSSLGTYFSLVPVANSISAVPLSPAGWGVGEAAYGQLFALVGGSLTLGVAVSVTYRLCNMGLSLVGGLFLFLPGARVSRADLRRLEELGPEPSQSRRGV